MERENQLNRGLCLMRHGANCLKHTDWANAEHYAREAQGRLP